MAVMKTYQAQHLNSLLERQEEQMLVNQIISGSIFMTAEESRPIRVKDLDILSSDILSNKDKLQSLIWNKNVMVKKLYVDDNNCIVSEVSLDNKPLKEYLAS